MHRTSRSSRGPSPNYSRNPLLTAGGVAVLLAGIAGILSSIVPLGAQSGSCTPPTGNPIVCENQLTGNPASEWDLPSASPAGDASIQGFATDISVNRGS